MAVSKATAMPVRRKNQLVPEHLVSQEEHSILHILIGTGQLHFNKSLVVNTLNFHNLMPDFILLLLESFSYKFQEYKGQQQIALVGYRQGHQFSVRAGA